MSSIGHSGIMTSLATVTPLQTCKSRRSSGFNSTPSASSILRRSVLPDPSRNRGESDVSRSRHIIVWYTRAQHRWLHAALNHSELTPKPLRPARCADALRRAHVKKSMIAVRVRLFRRMNLAENRMFDKDRMELISTIGNRRHAFPVRFPGWHHAG